MKAWWLLLALALVGCAPVPRQVMTFTCYADGEITFRARVASIKLDSDGSTDVWLLHVIDGGKAWDWSPVAHETAPNEACGPAIERPPSVD